MAVIPIENLDLVCARAGKFIAEQPSQELKKLITDALSVIEEQGVYALFLFLQERGEKDKTGKVNATWGGLEKLLTSTPQHSPLLAVPNKIPGTVKDGRNAREVFFASLQENLTSDLEKLLLAQTLLRQTLVYARYHAQPEEKEKSS